MMAPRPLLSLIVALPLSITALPAISDVRPLLQEGKQTLHQRVLTTPGCQLAEQEAGSSGELQPAFSRFYVYQRREHSGEEWLEVGPDSYGSISGWLPASCTVDWKMQLTLSFTNPANRDRLIFFDEQDGLMTIFDDFEPSAQVAPLRAQLRRDGQASGVVAQEPEYFVDLHEQFYLLPILEGEEIMTEAGFMTRLLRVASVSEAAEEEVQQESGDVSAQLREFNAGVVFVIDSTISMGPYIERTREAVERIYQRIEQEDLTDQVRFGLVSYRDSVDHAPDTEYVTRMYADPGQVEDGRDFMDRVAGLSEAQASTVGWEEDAYAGVMQAIDEVEWSNFGARYIVLITDASAIEGDGERSSTGLDADQVRLEAARHGIAVYTLHLKTPAGEQRGDHAVAEAQYSNLSTFTGTGTSLYYPVDTGDVAIFGQRVDALAAAITDQVHAAYLGDEAIGSALHAEEPLDDPSQQRLVDDMALIGHAMQLAYLGQATGSQAPPIFEAWISDRDLIAQHVPTTEVRVLLTKGQLSDLSDVVSEILDAANAGLISPTDMFDRLRSVAAAMGADPNQMQQSDGQRLGELGLMGEYLEDLPYQSEVLNLDEETWLSWDGLQQERFIRRLTTKLRHYQRYNEDVDRWVSLAEGADPRDDVYPVPLEMMP
ncbi:vWA domain-containing protein [Halomonas salipaludis]|uniref:Serine/threonine protein kinase n=1 Tax=Halomonas salipaludis TaxID=2032625 RepID=A0A2A2EZ36_9GAMM|nr:vWA domain-containing protein [Halomonas salipaludis]PAU77573.1 serine/threonine protein kinase [Halomonas salipaludis]